MPVVALVAESDQLRPGGAGVTPHPHEARPRDQGDHLAPAVAQLPRQREGVGLFRLDSSFCADDYPTGGSVTFDRQRANAGA